MELFTLYKLQIFETAIIVLLYTLSGVLFNAAVDKAGVKFGYQKSRIKILKKVLRAIATVVALIFLLVIWGVDQSRLLIFLSSFLTVLGIAFVAQWSILSNITATVIIFFNHPIKIGDTISIAEKDAQVEGRISDIGMFFTIIKTTDGEMITIPNNLFLQKAIRRNIEA